MFKNLFIYRLSADISGPGDSINERPARDPGALETATQGWGFVSPKSDSRMHNISGCSILCHERREKILPAQVVTDAVSERVDQIESAESRNISRSEKMAIKDQVLTEMLPKAFKRIQKTMVLIDHAKKLLIVDTQSPKRADDVTMLLRDTIGSLPLLLIKVAGSPNQVLTRLFQSGSEDEAWGVGSDTVLMDPARDKGAIRIKSLDQTQDEIRSHLGAGRLVQEIELTFNERLNVLLSDDIRIKRIKYLDLIQDAIEESDAENDQERFDADMMIMIDEIRAIVPAVFLLFGGEVVHVSTGQE
jgi:recombination associated protein RdgC